MKNSSSYSYSHAYAVRWALEIELSRLRIFEDRQEMFRVINYFEERIAELKEEEAICLKAQVS
jgi:hypothetical protein